MNESLVSLISLILYFILSAITPLSLYGTALLLSEKKPNPEKNSSFECGQVSVGKAHLGFTIQYYPYALIYGVFTAFAILVLISAPGLAELELGTKLIGSWGLPFIVISIMALIALVASTALSRIKLWRG